MKSREPQRISCSGELLKIAAKAGRLANEVSRETEAYRMAGRLNRLVQFQMSDLNEREVTNFAEAHVQSAKTGNDLFLPAIPIASTYYRVPSRKCPTACGKTSGMKRP